MEHARRTLGVIAASALSLALIPCASWAESASKTGEASEFLAGTDAWAPHAGGTKIDGSLSVVYDKEPRLDPTCTLFPPALCVKSYVKNMHISLTLDQGNLRLPFTTDYLNGARPHRDPIVPGFSDPGFFLNTNVEEQARTVLDLITQKVIPFFFNCTAATPCPGYKIKALTNFQYTTGHDALRPFPNSGGFSADISIAVQ
jgi:hypothetical protein